MYNPKYKKRILFVGIPDMAYICLDGLIANGFNIVGVIGAKKTHTTYTSFKNFVLNRHLNYIEYENLKAPEFIKEIKKLKIDIAVVCSFNYKIPKELLSTTKDGFINVHPSLLPKYRGGNPYSRVLINRESETGVTIHFMDENWDTGDMISQQKIIISDRETMGSLFNKLNLLGIKLLINVLKDYEVMPLPRFKQPKGDFITGKSISDADLYINYNDTSENIDAFIRGLNPFLNATTSFRGTIMKVFSAEYETCKLDTKYLSGQIVKIENDKIYIATKDGFIIPTVMQFGSYFVCNSKDFINFVRPKIGEEFK